MVYEYRLTNWMDNNVCYAYMPGVTVFSYVHAWANACWPACLYFIFFVMYEYTFKVNLL